MFESLKGVLINMVTSFMISAKLFVLGHLKIKVCRDKGHDVIISVNDVTSPMISRDLKYIVHVVM